VRHLQYHRGHGRQAQQSDMTCPMQQRKNGRFVICQTFLSYSTLIINCARVRATEENSPNNQHPSSLSPGNGTRESTYCCVDEPMLSSDAASIVVTHVIGTGRSLERSIRLFLCRPKSVNSTYRTVVGNPTMEVSQEKKEVGAYSVKYSDRTYSLPSIA